MLQIVSQLVSFTGEGVVVVGGVFNLLAEAFNRVVYIPMTTEPIFARGFWTCFSLMLVLGGFFSLCRRFINWIRRFFQPTKVVAYNNGPSAYDSTRGCLIPIVILLVVSVVFLLSFWFGYLEM